MNTVLLLGLKGKVPYSIQALGLELHWGWSCIGAGAALGLEPHWGWSCIGAGAALGLIPVFRQSPRRQLSYKPSHRLS